MLKKINLVGGVVVLSVLLAGCKTTQTPYTVTKSVNYQKQRPGSFYDFGITEEKVNDRIYYVTAKLEGTSDAKRAKDMWLLHAANLTLKNNFERFTSEKLSGGRWCYFLSNRTTGQKQAEDGGPKYRGFVLMANTKKELAGKKRIYHAKTLKKNIEAKVAIIIDEATMQESEQRYMDACNGK